MNKRDLYKGEFNWYGQDMTEYCWAVSPKAAFTFMVRRIAERLKYKPQVVFKYFYGHENWSIRKEST